jgi:diguanylate cyclase (GGDEF)-like protein
MPSKRSPTYCPEEFDVRGDSMKWNKASRRRWTGVEDNASQPGSQARPLSTSEGIPGPMIGVAQTMEALFRQLQSAPAEGPKRVDLRTWQYDPLWQLSLSDPHTGLANQLLLRDRLAQALSRRQRHGGQVIVMHMALTNMDDIHSELGHVVGNDVVFEVSRRLTSCLREEDTVGRVGGSELVAVMTIDHEKAAEILVKRLQDALYSPINISGRGVLVTASLGVAVAHEAESADEVLARADRAA